MKQSTLRNTVPDYEILTPEWISQLRAHTKLTQKDFCDKYLISIRTFRSWEQGARTPGIAGTALLNGIANRFRAFLPQ